MSKPHLSNSQLELLSMCGEAYRRAYIEREFVPPGIAMLRGTAVHGGAEENFLQKIESHRDLPVSQIVDAAVSAFDEEVNEGVTFDSEEASRGPAVVIGEARDDVADMAEVHAKKQAPDYQPIGIEELVKIELPGPRDLWGVIDLRDDQGRVTDLKTAQRAKKASDADESLQLTIYAAAHEALTGAPPTAVRLDTIVQTKTETKRQVLESTRGPDDLRALAARINAANAAIDAGVFLPASPSHWKCSAKWCSYHATCAYFVRRES